MLKHPFYLVYGLLSIGLAGYAEHRGWSLLQLKQVSGVPRSVRENPGIYRPIYRGLPHYTGGK